MLLNSELITILQKLPPTAEVLLRDIHGLDWELEENKVFIASGKIIIDSTDINKPDMASL
jgi:hypothetical protein